MFLHSGNSTSRPLRRALATLCLGTLIFLPALRAQSTAPRPRLLAAELVEKPVLTPAVSIPVAPLGFTAPNSAYLGERHQMASLDFVDENHLLFSFRVPALLHRDDRGNSSSDELHQVRALVLALPSGAVDTETLWTLHDHVRYLWMLNDGHFLLRDGNGVSEGDRQLETKPLLRFPGQLLWIDLDPSQQYLACDSFEPLAKSSPASSDDDDSASSSHKDIAVRILQRESGKVLLVSRVRSSFRLPVNEDGYLEVLRDRGLNWLLNLNQFDGTVRTAAQIQSTCTPGPEFLTRTRMVSSICGLAGEQRLAGLTTSGKMLCVDELAPASIWPQLIHSADGSRLAQISLITHAPLSASSPFDPEDVKGQMVRVLDAASGESIFTISASPALDVAGNVALSPSGSRLAVLRNGALEVYDLPAAGAKK
ncbi:hypothetical protein ACOBR2_05030 [Telmatobacter bradus]|uniref:hypothetical protein n=1 Tax=Telmatobacter bradus TaxID=474953 RepID=UPI003B43631B